MQWMTLLSAVAGALIAAASAAVLDRSRRRREQDDRLLGARRTLYGEYLTCLSQARNTFRGLARMHDMEPVERARTARDSFAPCYGARYQMSITAASPVVTASEEAFRRLRDVRDLAAAGNLAGDEAYSGGRAGDEAYSGGRAGDEAALARLREAMRLDLGAHRVPSRAPDPLGHRPDGRGIAFSPPLHALAPLLALHRPTAREEAELGRIWSVRNLCAGAPVRPDPRAPV